MTEITQMTQSSQIDAASFVDARSQAQAIAVALRKAARHARAPVSLVSGGGGFRARKGGRAFVLGVYLSFFLCVFLPIIGSGIYYALIASPQFVSEAHFSVRNGEQSPMDMLGSMTGFPQTGRFQDALIVTNYIYSRSMIEQVDAKLNLRRIFSGQDIDFFSRLPAKDPIEYIEYYWKRQVDVEIDNLSGIITLRVRAFKSKDAYDIANFIINASEKVVNNLAERTREDALRQTQKELDAAESNLRDQVKAMRDLRNQEGTLDVDVSAQAIGTVVTTLRLELAKLEETYQSSASLVAKNAPQMKILASRIDAVKKSIADYQAKLTSTTANVNTISEKSSKFATQQLAIDIGQNRYVSAAIAFESAKSEINTQRIYLVTFAAPTTAEKALYPKRLLNWIIISLPAAAIWGLGLALAFLVRDYAAA